MINMVFLIENACGSKKSLGCSFKIKSNFITAYMKINITQPVLYCENLWVRCCVLVKYLKYLEYQDKHEFRQHLNMLQSFLFSRSIEVPKLPPQKNNASGASDFNLIKFSHKISERSFGKKIIVFSYAIQLHILSNKLIVLIIDFYTMSF